MKFQDSFVKKVADGFAFCGVSIDSVNRIGAGVSGGADSVAMLLSLVKIFGSDRVFVVTVNHNIRPENETKGDADFVVSLCEKLSVQCKVVEIQKGKIEKISAKSGGIEAAARKIRYEAFENCILEETLDFLCLAHNQNDQLETSLMRFLQGSGCDGEGGIKFRRGKFIRPLLKISRSEIEEFLKSEHQVWRTDLTNFDENYLRNKIRNNLIPKLNELFEGWGEAVLSGVEKNQQDSETLKKITQDIFDCDVELSEDKKTASILRKSFLSLEDSVKRRLIYRLLSEIPYSGRFPFKLVRELLSWTGEKNCFLKFENVKFSMDSSDSDSAKFSVSVTDSFDSAEIVECGFYKIREISSKKFIFRSFQNGDVIRMKNGKMKEISKIFSEWKVSKADREKIAVVQDSVTQENVAVLGKKIGYYDWIISDYGFYFSTADI